MRQCCCHINVDIEYSELQSCFFHLKDIFCDVTDPVRQNFSSLYNSGFQPGVRKSLKCCMFAYI